MTDYGDEDRDQPKFCKNCGVEIDLIFTGDRWLPFEIGGKGKQHFCEADDEGFEVLK